MIALLLLVATTLPSADALLARSIEYHDPDERWLNSKLHLEIVSPLDEGGERLRACTLDYRDYSFHMKQVMPGATIDRWVEGDACRSAIDGREPTPAEIESERLDCDRNRMYRNYIAYLWGLPMKLRDPGTQLDPEVQAGEYDGREVWTITVRYDAEVGSDTYLIHFDPDTAAMIGYEFFHDEPTDGEYILLEGELVVDGIRIPQSRDWYRTKGDEYLGRDHLRAAKILESR